MNDRDDFHRVATIFEDCRERSGDDRRRVLEARCAGDRALRAEVESLLDAHDRSADALDGDAAGLALIEGAASVPESVGRYRIVSVLGAGGMGVVYLAEQDAPRRRVALKLLPAAFATESARRRFQHEAQALGRLDHPGVARIYEAGVATDDAGRERPYFAMELVEGRPVTDAARELSVRDRLDLFARVCDAVQHAHQRGVIHRDLKPSNILVDGRGDPRVLDFGVARLTGADVQTATLRTTPGQIVGTVQYMSPEQAAADPDRLDTRADVYALGALLYELLAGRPPHDLAGTPIAEALRIVRDEDPPSLATADPEYRGDLDTIARKALEKDPARRYASASELAEDVRHVLRDEPIAARAPSAVYQASKFVRRHRVAVAAAGAVALALVAGVVASGLALVQANRNLARATAAESVAVDRLEETRREAARAQAVRAFLEEMLASVQPENTPDREITVREALEAAATRIDEGGLAPEPLVEASVRTTIGETFRQIGLPESSEPNLRAAIGTLRAHADPNDGELARALTSLGGLLKDGGDFDGAAEIYSEALAICRAAPEFADRVPILMDNLGVALCSAGDLDEAERLFRAARPLHAQHYGERSLEVATSENNIGFVRYGREDFEGAAKHFERALEIQRELVEETHPDVLRSYDNLASTYQNLGRVEEAVEMQQRSLALRTETLGPDHPDLLFARAGLGSSLRVLERHDEAVEQYREAIRLIESAYEPDHPYAAIMNFNIGMCERKRERYDEAEARFLRAAEIRLARDDPAEAAKATNAAGTTRQMQDNLDRALEHHERAVELARALPADHPVLADSLLWVGLVRLKQERYGDAVPPLEECAVLRAAAAGDSDPGANEARARLGLALLEAGRVDDALTVLNAAHRNLSATLGDDDWRAAEAASTIGACLLEMDRADEAAPLLRDGFAALDASGYAGPARLAWIARRLQRACAALGLDDEAAEWADRADSLERDA